MSITIHQGSILDSKADYLVNPANSFLNHGGGLARVIANAAAPYASVYEAMGDIEGWETSERWMLQQEVCPLIATGNAAMTSAGALPYKGIIHAVGPIWNGGDFMEWDLLEMVHESVYRIAENAGARSIAFPAISSGIFGCPIGFVARIACEIATWYPKIDTEFWLFFDDHYRVFFDACP